MSRILKSTIDAYARQRPFFYCLIRPQEAHYFHIFRKYIRPPCLDFGCDDGFFANLAYKTPIHTGLDLPSSNVLAPVTPGIYTRTITYNGQTIPLKDHSLATIVSNCVFEHVADIQASLKEMFRVLKPGGHLLTTVMLESWEQNLLGSKIIGDSYRSFLRRRQVHRNLFPPTLWQNLFNRFNFSIIDSRGYLGPKAAAALELVHYLSFPQLITHHLTHQWTVFPQLTRAIGRSDFIYRLCLKDLDTPLARASAAFYLLQKPRI